MRTLQTRAAVYTIAESEEVLVVVIIVHTSNIGNHTGTVIGTAYRLGLLTIRDVILIGSGEVGGISRQIVTILIVNLIAQEFIQMMYVCNSMLIGKLVAPHHFATLIEFLRHTTIDIITIRGTWVGPVLTLCCDIVVTEGTLEFQVLDKLILTINCIESTGDILTLGIIFVGKCRVAVADTNQSAVPCTILVVYRIRRSHSTSRRIERRSIGESLTVNILIDT